MSGGDKWEYIDTDYYELDCTLNNQTCVNSSNVPLNLIYYDNRDWHTWQTTPLPTSESNCYTFTILGSMITFLTLFFMLVVCTYLHFCNQQQSEQV